MLNKRKCYTNWNDVPVIIDPALAAVLLGRTVESITKLCRNGQIPATKLGGEWRISRDKLRAMLGEEGM